MLFALGWASGSGLVPMRAGLLWHPWLQRPVTGLRLVGNTRSCSQAGSWVLGGEAWLAPGGGVQDRFLAVAGPWALSGDKAQGGVGRVQTLCGGRGQAGSHAGWFRLVWSVCGIHTCGEELRV